ncbi:hypothetical protein SAMN06265379_101557 [Saccharicrinis carchari]|uniref:Uncharacterized protein n=1 Tax=Saccharicrinis carchari TaxID=1168039 RepID=A0A521B042_SACCC|nr:hypothetical protein SAMN06265379_101557 [Saccharicrinis carchari]
MLLNIINIRITQNRTAAFWLVTELFFIIANEMFDLNPLII